MTTIFVRELYKLQVRWQKELERRAYRRRLFPDEEEAPSRFERFVQWIMTARIDTDDPPPVERVFWTSHV